MLAIIDLISPIKCQSHKIVKHTQTIHWQQPTSCSSVLDNLVGLALKGLMTQVLCIPYKPAFDVGVIALPQFVF